MAICTKLEWAETPYIPPCAIGEPADFRGLKIIAIYDDGTRTPVDVIMKMFHETNMQQVGEQREAQIVFERKRLPVIIPLRNAVLERIEATPKSPLTFPEGETFDRSRVIVYAYYNDGSSRVIDNYKIAPHLPMTVADNKITFRYGRCAFELPLTIIPANAPINVPTDNNVQPSVNPAPQNVPTDNQPPVSVALAPPKKTVVAVSVAKKPNHQRYLVGDTMVDLKGGLLDIIYSDGSVGQINMVSDGPVYIDSKRPGEGSISFSCLGRAVSFPIDVIEAKISHLEIVKMPTKLDYYDGEKLNLAGLVLEASYNDGSKRVIKGLQSNGLEVNMGHADGGITLTYEGVPFTIRVNVKKKEVPVTALSVELIHEPNKTRYIENDPNGIDLSGAAILVQMSDGRRETIPVTREMIDPIDLSKPGRCLMTVRYMGFSASCSIYIQSRVLLGIEIASNPQKMKYIEGERLNLDGVEVRARFDNDDTIPITAYDYSPEYADVNNSTITFRYNDMTAVIPITVEPLQVTLLDWARQPLKTIYYTQEDKFSCDGGVLKVRRNDNSEEEVPLTPEMISGFRSDRIGPLLLKISYAGKTLPFSVTIKERVLLGLRVVQKPKLEYVEGEEFDPKGLVVEALYSGDTSEIVGVTYLPYGPLRLDTANVMLVYQDKAVVMPITVKKTTEHHPIIVETLNPTIIPSPPSPSNVPTHVTERVYLNEPVVPSPKREPELVHSIPVQDPDPSAELKNLLPESLPARGEHPVPPDEDPFDQADAEPEPKSEPESEQSTGRERRKSSVPGFYPSSFGMRFTEE